MSVTIPVPMTQEEQAILLAHAEAQGVGVDSLLRKAVFQIIAAAPEVALQELSNEQWQKEFEEWLDGLPDLPTLPDEALSRESIYTREDECL